MIDAAMNPAVFPWALDLDARIRTLRVVDPARTYPLGPLNRHELVEVSTVMGHEGSDYQNPNVWQGRGVLAYPNEQSPSLVPTFGIGGADSYADVLLNVQSTQHLAVINV